MFLKPNAPAVARARRGMKKEVRLNPSPTSRMLEPNLKVNAMPNDATTLIELQADGTKPTDWNPMLAVREDAALCVPLTLVIADASLRVCHWVKCLAIT
jgi:hypothetical protein